MSNIFNETLNQNQAIAAYQNAANTSAYDYSRNDVRRRTSILGIAYEHTERGCAADGIVPDDY